VLVGVIGFPLLFDTQPRPIAVDIPIEIPDRAKVKPLPAPPPSNVVPAAAAQDGARTAAAPASAASQAATNSKPVPAAPARDVGGPVADAGKPAAPAQQARAEPVARPVADPVKGAPEAARPAKAADTSHAQALEDKPGKAHEADGRFVVQVGAFSDVGKAREARLRVERAGLKTYTHVADTRDGRRIRVRVGPFASRADADKAASRIKELDLPASILTL
jgi:DedD protein